jgi:hypothetical protein
VTESTLEAALRDLGRQVAWPETPDLAGAVAERIGGAEVRPLPRRPVRRSLVLVAAVMLVVVGGTMALSPGIRAAILRFFSLPGVRIEVQESAPPGAPTVTPSPGAPGVTSFLGRPVGLGQARRRVGFPVVVPSALGRPDETYLVGAGDGAMVTLAYRDLTGVPEEEETGWAALLTELRGRPTEQLIKKVTLGANVTEVMVGGERGFFIEGPHEVYVQGRGKQSVLLPPRLAGNTLLWTRDAVTLRLEADVSLSRALDIARTVR